MSSPVNAAVGRNIRTARELHGWSQAELGERCGRSQTAISYYESGARALSVDDLIAIANALHVTPRKLLPGQPSDEAPALVDMIRERLDAAPDTADGILAMQAALFAVLELHPSDRWHACVRETGKYYQVITHRGGTTCDEVRAIAEKLGIEVDGG